MLMNRESSGFLLVDVQDKLTPLVLNAGTLIERCQWLIRLSIELHIPIVVSEQYPKGLGGTVSSLSALLNTHNPIEKIDFSCQREPAFMTQWQKIDRKQIVIAGIETHVCVMQTAMELHDAGFDVFVVVDAVSSRHEIDHKYGLKRMKQAGIHLVTAEMVFF